MQNIKTILIELSELKDRIEKLEKKIGELEYRQATANLKK
jgi:hypothetical protein